MRGVVEIAIVATLVAVAYGAVDWTGAESTITQIETSVSIETFRQVSQIAKEENPTIGKDIEKKLDGRGNAAEGILNQARGAISSRAYSYSEAQGHFEKFGEVLEAARKDVQTDAAKLSKEAQRKISDAFDESFSAVERLKHELYAILQN